MLKYLFKAYYNDGTSYQQSEDDRSTQDSSKSAFYDIDQEKLIAFEISSADTNVFVDLRDGSFGVNGLPFYVCEDNIENRRLVYFRRIQQRINFSEQESATTVLFHVGWQGNDPVTGQNVQRVLAFA